MSSSSGKPLLISFLGFPGSGKTTFARQLAEEISAVTYNSDALRVSMFGSLETIEQIRQMQRSRLYDDVFGAMNYAAAQSLRAGHHVIYDAQMTKRRDRQRMDKLARDNGGQFVLIWLQTSPKAAIQRAQTREVRDDSHPYPLDKITMLVERFEQVTDMPGADEHVVEISGEVPFRQQYDVLRKATA